MKTFKFEVSGHIDIVIKAETREEARQELFTHPAEDLLYECELVVSDGEEVK